MSKLIKTLNKYSCQKHGKDGVDNCLACEIWLDIKSAIDCIEALDMRNRQPAESLTRAELESAHTYLLSENIKQSGEHAELQAQLTRVCEWHEVSCYDELPFVIDELREGDKALNGEES